MEAPLPIAVLVSGTGTNLQALLDTVHTREAEIVAVASNVAEVPALERARARGVPTAVFAAAEHASREQRDRALGDWLLGRGARLVVLAGYMELLGDVFLARFPRAVINVHPSLLPAFPGLRAVEQALAYGVKVFGVTVHFVDAGIDMSSREEMIAHGRTVEEVAAELGCDSLHYLSLGGVYEAVGATRATHCDACFSGSYPLRGSEDAQGKYALEQDRPLARA